MDKVTLHKRDKVAIYQAFAILAVISYYAERKSCIYDWSNFLGCFGIWLAIVLPVILGIEKLRDNIIWRDLLCLFISFTFLGFTGSSILNTRLFIGLILLPAVAYYFACVAVPERIISLDKKDTEEKYPTRLSVILFIGGITYFFPGQKLLMSFCQFSYGFLIYYTYISLYDVILSWNLAGGSTNHFSTQLKRVLRYVTASKITSNNPFREKRNAAYFSIFTGLSGLLLGFCINVLFGTLRY